MCGICGVYSNVASVSLEGLLFRDLLYINFLRGQDSTGVVKVNTSGKITFVKSLLSAPQFLAQKEYQQFLNDKNFQCFIGHTRAATVGTVTRENAHPFDFPKVIGVHNGTIKKLFKHDREYETDSEAIYAGIDGEGLVDTLKDIASTSSAYALVWIDKTSKTLNFLRNEDRPLTFTFVYGRSTLIWSSTKEMLETICNVHKLVPTGWAGETSGDDRFFTLKPHDLLQVKLGQSAKTATLEKVDVDPKPNKPVVYAGGGDKWTQKDEERWLNNLSSSGTFPAVTHTQTPSQKGWKKDENGEYYNDDEIDPLEDAEFPFEKKNKAKFKSIKYDDSPPTKKGELKYKLEQGCANCGMIPDIEDVQLCTTLSWVNRDHFFCADCQGTPLFEAMTSVEIEE